MECVCQPWPRHCILCDISLSSDVFPTFTRTDVAHRCSVRVAAVGSRKALCVYNVPVPLWLS